MLRKALAKDPDDRFSTCGEFVAAASEALKVETPVVKAGTRRTIPGVRTFLIADIRGYTSYTHEHGDEAAAELASGFADVVRTTVEGRDGRLIELRGDEALVVFDSTRQALRAAVELQERVGAADLPRGIGIGLDAGEAVPVGEGYRGGALNLAARLCSLAGPGEVLASETVLQLARTVEGIRYGARRVERVKGLAKPVPLVEVLPEGRRIRKWDLRRLRRHAHRLLGSRRVRLSAGAALAAGGAVAGVLLAFTDGEAARAQIAPNTLGLVTAGGKVKGQIPVGGVVDVASGAGGLWAANGDDGTVGRVDLKTRRLVKPLVSLGVSLGGFAVGEGYVWVEDENSPTLLRIDPRYRTIDRFKLPAERSQIDTTASQGLATGAGSVWVATANEVFRVEPRTGKVRDTIDVPGGTEIDYADGAVWVTSAGFGTIKEINPRIDQVVKTIKLHDWLGGVGIGGGYVWGTIAPDDTLWKIDKNGNVLKTFDIGHSPGTPVYFDGYMWVPLTGWSYRTCRPELRPGQVFLGRRAADHGSGREQGALRLRGQGAGASTGSAEGRGRLLQPGGGLPRRHRSGDCLAKPVSGAARIRDRGEALELPGRLLPEGRPASSRGRGGDADRLGRWQDVHVPNSARLPFLPAFERSGDGRDLQVHARTGALAEAWCRSPAVDLLGDIVGARAFHDGKAKHVSGILASGDRLTIRLTAAAGDFLARVSLPFFAAVPVGTPIVDGGLQRPIPSAGPYYLEQKFDAERVVLERNPNYHGPRPHRLQRIVYDIGNSTRRALSRINAARRTTRPTYSNSRPSRAAARSTSASALELRTSGST